MQRAELTAEVTEGTETELARVRVSLPDGTYAIWFLTVDTTGRAPVLEVEAALDAKMARPKPARVSGQWRKNFAPVT